MAAQAMASPAGTSGKGNFGARMAALRAKKKGAPAPSVKGKPKMKGKMSFGQRMAALRAAKKGKAAAPAA